jgi:tetratricopeptide (TPR) repeat protein
LTQSCFSFVFHLLPSTLLLGICLGQMSRVPATGSNARTCGTRILLTILSFAGMYLLFPIGWKGTQVSSILWDTYFNKTTQPSDESRIDALTEAIGVWPQSGFYQLRGDLLYDAMHQEAGPGSIQLAERALKDYQEVAKLQPYEPAPHVTCANLLSFLKHDDEAEKSFAKAIQLQGGMESAFRSRYSLALHYLNLGARKDPNTTPEDALSMLEKSAEQFEQVVKQTPNHVIGLDGAKYRVAIHESLGMAREAAGDPEGALQCYDFASTLRDGAHAHYRAGVLLGRRAVGLWEKRRSEEAMYEFIEARKRIGKAGNQLPQGVTLSDRVTYIDYLDRNIAFLKGAKVVPKKGEE